MSWDELDFIRIPFEKIMIGRKLEVQGVYGTMFEGVFEGEFGDKRVALKILNMTNLANIKPKLLDEILTISRMFHHSYLVALLGFCDEKSNEIILVYKYVASENLADKLCDPLTTIQRLQICIGAANGLDYLHTGVVGRGIVHGNVKLSKILLLNSDANSSSSTEYKAKVSSYGLSKIMPGRALESADDVYSFGVVLLEVLCGASELVDTDDDYQERHVTELVPKKMQHNKLRQIVHFDIRDEIKMESLETYAKIACQCVMEDPDARPNMAQVVEELEKALRLQRGESSSPFLKEKGKGCFTSSISIRINDEDDEDLEFGRDTSRHDFFNVPHLDVSCHEDGDQSRSIASNGDSGGGGKTQQVPQGVPADSGGEDAAKSLNPGNGKKGGWWKKHWHK